MTMAVIDADTHLVEPRNVWATHLEAARQHLAVRITDDELGYAWLCGPNGDPIHPAEVHTPGDIAPMGLIRARQRQGRPAEVRYDDALAAHDTDPTARVALLDQQGVAEAVVFPNYGLFWVRALERTPDAQLANMEAWNRWITEDVMPAGGGRLRPVGHVSLRDERWLDGQLRRLAHAGVGAAMIPIGPVDGRSLGNPDLDRRWSLLEEHGIAVMFHISDGPRPFADAWYEQDVNPVEPLLMSTFISVTPMLALADLAISGVLERHPDLRIGLVEFTSSWFGPFLRSLDASYRFHGVYNGLPASRLPLAPSEYLRRQVRVATFGFEHPEHLAGRYGDVFMFGSDYPHAEGLADPLPDFEAAGGPAPGDTASGLYRDNIRWLLGDG
jgi:predicted TIM-barrel fold metal-dependent hydrolase